jgi:hypothetical protein
MALPIAPSEWASLLGWFLAAAAVSAAIIYAIERKKK